MNRLTAAIVGFSLIATPALANKPKSTQDPTPIERIEQAERPVLDVVFVLDTTSSMGGLIEGAKQKIWSIASRMAAGKPTPKVRVGLVAYRDQGDAYVTQIHPLSEDLDAVYKTLMSFRAEGGGDGPEAVQDGLADAVEKMQWSDAKKVAKMIFVVGDAPAHPQDIAKLNGAAKTAISKGIVVNTIRCGADANAGTQFTQVAKFADGRFDSIDQSGGVLAVATPYDADLARLNAELMDTTLYAGRGEAMAAGEKRKEEAKAMAPAAAADRVSYASKAGGGAGTRGDSFGAVDLAAAPEKAASMNDDELPAQMKKMSKEERVAFARKQQAQRQEIEGKIVELAKKRDAFVAKESATKKDSFDARVFESVKASAAKAGIAY
jgi:hypothetical protein